MRYLLSLLLFFSFAATAQHTSPLVNAGSDINITLPVRNTNVSANVTYYDGATMLSQGWTKVQTPRQPRYTIVIIGSSTSAGYPYGANDPNVWGKRMQTYYQPLGLVDSVHMGGVNGGATLWSLNITTELNKGGSNPYKLYVFLFPGNGYNGNTYTDAQILGKLKEWTDSATARGCPFLVGGTQPRQDFAGADQSRLERLNDSIGTRYPGRFINTMLLAKTVGAHTWKSAFSSGDGVHGDLDYHAALADAVIATNIFKFVAENFDKIRTSSSTSTAIDSLSYKGKHLYQFSVIDNQGHGGSDIVAVNANSSCTGTRYNAVSGEYWNNFNLQPGDTLNLGTGTYKWVAVLSKSGTAGCPIVIQNSGGVATITATTLADRDASQLRIESGKYIQIRGDGSKDARGIRIQPYKDDSARNGSYALAILGKSKNIEVNNLLIRNAGIGMSIKDEGQCDSTFNFPLWTIDSITVNNNTVIRMFNQGLYVGNTAPDNNASLPDNRPVDCGGVTKYPLPARMGNIRIFNNYIDSTGRAGIQLSSASTAFSYIYDNIVRHAGLTGDQNQGAGINLGAYSRVQVTGNTIFKTLTYGISSFGASGTFVSGLQILNNNIDSSGFLPHYNATGISDYSYSGRATVANNLTFPYSIFVCTKPTENPIDSTRFSIQNNILGRRKNSGGGIGLADYQNTFHKSGNFICGNINSYGGSAGIVREEIIFIWYSQDCSRRRNRVKTK